uniref:Myb/SANT-like domain-containing protein n=1 Tax=Phytophthora ramorum TaxID=164328 RepID=H3HAZ9_PHYRM
MVLFVESEALRLLDLYMALRAEPHNVTNGGVLLKQRAREELTRQLNASFARGTPWTEGQVSVKFKNLRGEYAELKWLSAQPGFRADGAGLSDDWWRDVKSRRPKCHAFKGKLPWAFESKMQLILGDAEKQQQMVKEGDEVQDKEQEQEEQPIASIPSPRRPQHKRKRDNDDQRRDSGDWEQGSETTQSFDGGERSQGYGRSLSRSVEHSAVAAAGMARGFQDLTVMFQDEAARCRALEQQSARNGREPPSLADQRSVLLAIAHSLEHSTRATADMAKGYRELVSAFVRETDVQREL